MNKKQFLDKLRKELGGLNPEERKRQLDYYEEMINDRIDDGMSEEEAVWQLGTVQSIAKKIMSEADPEQLKQKKKKIGKVGWIVIALAALLLIGAAIVVEEYLDYRFDDFDIEEMIEERLDLDGGWTSSGADASFAVNEVSALDIVWGFGDVTVDESEGSELVIKAGDADSLEYQLKDGVLYVEGKKDFSGSADLKVLIPEDIMQLSSLSIVTTAGKVTADGEYFAEVSIETHSGDVRLNPEDCTKVSIVTASGSVYLELDEDEAFTMDYKTDSGDVSVDFDRGFKNESSRGKAASYDHSRGYANALCISVTTESGDIDILDD